MNWLSFCLCSSLTESRKASRAEIIEQTGAVQALPSGSDGVQRAHCMHEGRVLVLCPQGTGPSEPQRMCAQVALWEIQALGRPFNQGLDRCSRDWFVIPSPEQQVFCFISSLVPLWEVQVQLDQGLDCTHLVLRAEMISHLASVIDICF